MAASPQAGSLHTALPRAWKYPECPLAVVFCDDERYVQMASQLLGRRIGLPKNRMGVPNSSEELLTLLAEHPEWRRVLVLQDIEMRGETGVDCLRKVRDAGYGEDVVAFVGATAYPRQQHLSKMGFAGLIEKPFNADRLRTFVQRFEDGPGGWYEG